jgi:hypothetical protein
MYKQKYFKYKQKYLNLNNSKYEYSKGKFIGGDTNINIDKKLYLKMLTENLNLFNVDINFPMYFVVFCKRIEKSLENYLKENSLDKIYVLGTSEISNIIILYLKTLSKCKYCEFICLTKNDVDNVDLYKNLPNNFKQIIIMDYVSQYDNIKIFNKIIKNLKNKNNLELSKTKYFLTNNEILDEINKYIDYCIVAYTDPIIDNKFNDKFYEDYKLENNFLNLYDYVNISSANILINYDKDKYILVKILTLTYIYYDEYQKILSMVLEKINSNLTNSNSDSNIIIVDE